MEKRYVRNGMGIIIPLGYKGFFVEANILRTTSQFEVTYKIAQNGIPKWDAIEGDVFLFPLINKINTEVVNFTMDKFAEGYFKPFMDSYELELEAIEIGMEVLEKRRDELNDSDNR